MDNFKVTSFNTEGITAIKTELLSHLNTEILGEIRTALSNVDQEILYNSHNIQEFNSIMTQLSTSFLQVDRHLQEIQSHKSKLQQTQHSSSMTF